MKKSLVIVLGGGLLFILLLTSLANMNMVNLLITNSGQGSASTSKMDNHNVEDGIGEDSAGVTPVNPYTEEDGGGTTSETTLETLQSGLSAGGGSGSINLLWLLQNAKDPDKESYAYQLLNAYSKLQNGDYNDYEYHVSPDAIAGSHFNETKLTSFVVPTTSGYGKATSGILGKEINGRKITLENAKKDDIIGNVSKTGSVWADKDSSGGDGCPDGPFQIIQCSQKDSNADKNRNDKKYDLYNFVDAANVVDQKYNGIAKPFAESGVTPDANALSMLMGLDHNRGSAGVGWSLFGFPYDVSTSKKGKASKYLKRQTLGSMNSADLVVAAQFPKDLLQWFNSANIPIEEIAGNNSKGQGAATLLVLANGGFLDIPLQRVSTSNIKALNDSVIGKLFPGQTKSTIVDHVNNNFVKNPWDVLGMSKSEYDGIYGSGPYDNYEAGYSTPNGYYRNTVFYIDKNLKSDNYKAGNNVVVRAIEGISLGYLLDVGISGVHTIMQIAMEAGIKSLTDETIIDPSNPQVLYDKVDSSKGASFNPAGAASGDFGKFLEELGLAGTLTEPQQAQIQAMYNVSGGPYSQSKRGSKTSDGRYYMDCSSFAAVGLHMGLDKRIWNPNPQTGNIKSGSWLKSTNKTFEIKGKTYDAKVVQLDKSGKPMAGSTTMDLNQGRTDSDWLDYVQTGDIINGVRPAGSGHVFTYLGRNKTSNNMVLTQDVSKVNAGASKFKPGEHFTIQAYYTANKTYAGGTGAEDSGRMGLTKLWYDTKKPMYQAMRPVYNLR